MFETYLVQPIYNGFIFLIGVMPQGDVGLAIIALTLIVRAVFYPAFAASIRTQMGMQAAQGEIDEINKKYKDNAEERARKTLALFREKGIKPLSGLLALLVQIPVFFALYFAFFRENLPSVTTELLYSFVPAPDVVSVNFFGIIDLLGSHNIPLAIVVGGLQYAVAHLSFARVGQSAATLAPERAAMHNMQRQLMLFFLPAIMAVVSFTLPAAVGLYFAAGNVISLLQEGLIRRELARKR